MSEINYYIIDTETTGTTNQHEMTEIGIIRFKDKVQLCRNIKCEYPERASYDALKITNKTIDDLSKGLLKEGVVKECNKFFNEDGLTPNHRCIVCHNAPFDKRFLHALWEKCGQVFPANLWIDTLGMMRAFAKIEGLVKPKLTLEASCDLLGIKKIAEYHNAKVDSRNTYFLFKKLMDDKKVDYLKFMKPIYHTLKNSKTESVEEDFDMSVLDDVE